MWVITQANKLQETSNPGLSYTQKANILLDSIVKDIYPIIEKKPFEAEINYRKCVVEILPDDFRIIWVKWGPYDCALSQLNATALATVADNILKQNAVTQP